MAMKLCGLFLFAGLRQHRFRKFYGNTAQRMCGRCANRFFVRLHRNDAGILAYCKEFLCDMTENASADAAHSRQAGFVRCCLWFPCLFLLSLVYHAAWNFANVIQSGSEKMQPGISAWLHPFYPFCCLTSCTISSAQVSSPSALLHSARW